MTFYKKTAAILLLVAGAAAMVIQAPDVDRKLAWASDTLDAAMSSGAYYIDPAELLDLMYNNRVRLALLDVRDEGDYNLFHLIDAKRISFSDMDVSWLDNLPDETVHVVVSNDERQAEEAWKRLRVMGYQNLYVLTGGINLWLELCKPEHADPGREPAHVLKENSDRLGDEQLRYTFPAALGDLYPEARPKEGCFSEREYTSKVKVLKSIELPAGGCGG